MIFLENELLYGRSFEVPDVSDHVLPIGKASIIRSGEHLTITAFSIMVEKALEASDILATQGIEAEVIDLRSLKPLDIDTIVNSVVKTNRLLTVEEGWKSHGIGSEISALLSETAFDHLDSPVSRVGGVDVPLPYANNLEKLALPQTDNIVKAAKELCYAK